MRVCAGPQCARGTSRQAARERCRTQRAPTHLPTALLCCIGADQTQKPTSRFFSENTVMAVPETKDNYKGRSFPLPWRNQIAAFMLGLCCYPRVGSQRGCSMGWEALPMAQLGAWTSPQSSHRAEERLTGAS